MAWKPALKTGAFVFAGAKQLFWGDLHAESRNFQPLFAFLATDVVFFEGGSRLQQLPPQSRGGILAAVATFLPFYSNIMVPYYLSPNLDSRVGHMHTTDSRHCEVHYNMRRERPKNSQQHTTS